MSEALKAKYAITGWFYDVLDYPWERMYRRWRKELLRDIHGDVLEAGAGTGRNFAFYQPDVNLTALELSNVMLRKARKRVKHARCQINLLHGDAMHMTGVADNHYDWVFSTFMCCVMPDELQPAALRQFERVLKPGGQFKLLEMVYSNNPKIKRKQQFFAPYVEKVFGARFDRKTLDYIKQCSGLRITKMSFLKDDTYLLIEGRKE